VEALLAEARSTLVRLTPSAAARAQHDGALLVDIRPFEQRLQGGIIPGAVIIDRNVLEWRLDPGSPWRISEVTDLSRLVIVICAQGFSSSLAAASLQQVGVANATDVEGGFDAWLEAGLPVVHEVRG
jgi:rhodanese-related sulfurtransferase